MAHAQSNKIRVAYVIGNQASQREAPPYEVWIPGVDQHFPMGLKMECL